MFEGAVTWFINSVIGRFFENEHLSQENIRIGVWAGKVVLENMVLKKSLFDVLSLPYTLCHGSIGKFELIIPWSNLGNEPIVLKIDKVHFVVEPKFDLNINARNFREQTVKFAKLAAAELFANEKDDNDPFKSYRNYFKNWLVENMALRVFGSVQTQINDIHIRYENRQSCPTEFCIGLVIESISIGSDSESSGNTSNFYEIFPDLNVSGYSSVPRFHMAGKVIRQRMQISKVGLYWNPLVFDLAHPERSRQRSTRRSRRRERTVHPEVNEVTCLFSVLPANEVDLLLSKTIPKNGVALLEQPAHHYILHPMNINTLVLVSLSDLSVSGVKIDINTTISDLQISIEDNQFREILILAANTASFAIIERNACFRPCVKVKINPKAWWRYAINATLYEIRHRRTSVRWCDLHLRSKDKLVYMELWMSKLVNGGKKATHNDQSIDNQKKSFFVSGEPSITKDVESADFASITGRFEILYYELYQVGKERRNTRLASLSSKYGTNVNNILISSVNIWNFDEDMAGLLGLMEEKLSFEDIIFFRALAEKELSVTKVSQQNWIGGVISWATGNVFQSAEAGNEAEQKILQSLDMSFNKAKTKPVAVDNSPPFRILTSILKGSIQLCLSTPAKRQFEISSSSSKYFFSPISLPFLQTEISRLSVGTLVFDAVGSRMKTFISLQESETYETLAVDLWDENIPIHRKYRRLVSRRSVSSCTACSNGRSASRLDLQSLASLSTPSLLVGIHNEIREREQLGLNTDDEIMNIKLNESMKKFALPPLIYLSVEMAPPTFDYEVGCQVTLDEMEILVSPSSSWIKSMATFITWPKDLEYWSEMEIAVLNQFEDWKSRIDLKLEYMMNNHLNVMINMNMKAPVIVLFESNYFFDCYNSGGESEKVDLLKSADAVVIDLGKIVVYTERLAKSEHKKNMIVEGSAASVVSADSSPFPFRSNRSISSRNEVIRSDLFGDISDVNVETDESDLGESDHFEPFKGKNFKNSDLNPGMQNIDVSAYQNIFFDVFHVQVSQVELCLVSELDLLQRSWNFLDPKTEQKNAAVRLIDSFDVFMAIDVSTLPWDTTLPPVKLAVDLPALHVRISDEKIRRLIRFSNTLARHSEEMFRINHLKREGLQISDKPLSSSVRRKDDPTLLRSFAGRIRSRSGTATSTMSANPILLSGSSENVVDPFTEYISGGNSRSLLGRNFSKEFNSDALDSLDENYSSNFLMRGKKAKNGRDFGAFLDDKIRQRRKKRHEKLNAAKFVSEAKTVGFDINGSDESEEFILSDGSSGEAEDFSDEDNDSYLSAQEGDEIEIFEQLAGEDFSGEALDYAEATQFSVGFQEEYTKSSLENRSRELQNEIHAYEAKCAKLMSDIRISESDHAQTAQCRILKKELLEYEKALLTVKAEYVEHLMRLDKLNLENKDGDFSVKTPIRKIAVNTGDFTFGTTYTHAGQIVSPKEKFKRFYAFQKAPVNPGQNNLGERGGVGGNKELVYLTLSLPVVEIDFSVPNKNLPLSASRQQIHAGYTYASPSTGNFASPSSLFLYSAAENSRRRTLINSPSRGSLSFDFTFQNIETALIRMRMTGFALDLEHRALDSKIQLILREISIADLIGEKSSSMNGDPSEPSSRYPHSSRTEGKVQGDQVYLFSSVPTNVSLPFRVDAPICNNLDAVKIYYEVSFKKDKSDAVKQGIPARLSKLPLRKHVLKIDLGYFEINFEQYAIANLLDSVSVISSVSAFPAAVDASHGGATKEVDRYAARENFDCRVRMTGIISTVVSKQKLILPILGYSLWNFNLQVHADPGYIRVKNSISNFTMFQSMSLSVPTASKCKLRKIIECGSDAEASLSSLIILQASAMDRLTTNWLNESIIVSADISTAPVNVTIIPVALYEFLNTSVDQGPVLMAVKRMYARSTAKVSRSPGKLFEKPNIVPADETGLLHRFSKFLDTSRGSFILKLGQIKVTCSSDLYSSLQDSSDDGHVVVNYLNYLQEYNRLVKSPHLTNITAVLAELELRSIWGKCSGSFNMMESLIGLKDISIYVSDNQIIAPFSIIFQSLIVPPANLNDQKKNKNIGKKAHIDNFSETLSSSPLVSNKWKPTAFDRERLILNIHPSIHVSGSVSPICITLTPRCVVDCTLWMGQNLLYLNLCNDLVQGLASLPALSGEKSLNSSLNSSLYKSLIESTSVYFSCMLHEVSYIVYALDVNDNTSQSSTSVGAEDRNLVGYPKFGGSIVSVKTSIYVNPQPADDYNYLANFECSVGNIDIVRFISHNLNADRAGLCRILGVRLDSTKIEDSFGDLNVSSCSTSVPSLELCDCEHENVFASINCSIVESLQNGKLDLSIGFQTGECHLTINSDYIGELIMLISQYTELVLENMKKPLKSTMSVDLNSRKEDKTVESSKYFVSSKSFIMPLDLNCISVKVTSEPLHFWICNEEVPVCTANVLRPKRVLSKRLKLSKSLDSNHSSVSLTGPKSHVYRYLHTCVQSCVLLGTTNILTVNDMLDLELYSVDKVSSSSWHQEFANGLHFSHTCGKIWNGSVSLNGLTLEWVESMPFCIWSELDLRDNDFRFRELAKINFSDGDRNEYILIPFDVELKHNVHIGNSSFWYFHSSDSVMRNFDINHAFEVSSNLLELTIDVNVKPWLNLANHMEKIKKMALLLSTNSDVDVIAKPVKAGVTKELSFIDFFVDPEVSSYSNIKINLHAMKGVVYVVESKLANTTVERNDLLIDPFVKLSYELSQLEFCVQNEKNLSRFLQILMNSISDVKEKSGRSLKHIDSIKEYLKVFVALPEQFTSGLVLFCEMSVNVEYVNKTLMLWEPFLENSTVLGYFRNGFSAFPENYSDNGNSIQWNKLDVDLNARHRARSSELDISDGECDSSKVPVRLNRNESSIIPISSLSSLGDSLILRKSSFNMLWGNSSLYSKNETISAEIPDNVYMKLLLDIASNSGSPVFGISFSKPVVVNITTALMDLILLTLPVFLKMRDQLIGIPLWYVSEDAENNLCARQETQGESSENYDKTSVVNALACTILFRYRSSEMNKSELVQIRSGDSFVLPNVDNSLALIAQIYMIYEDTPVYSVENLNNEWSTEFRIPAAEEEARSPVCLFTELLSENKAVLTVSVEVKFERKDHHFSRNLSVFVPFWIVTSTNLHIQYQHYLGDNARENSFRAKILNGQDDLCADQRYREFSYKYDFLANSEDNFEGISMNTLNTASSFKQYSSRDNYGSGTKNSSFNSLRYSVVHCNYTDYSERSCALRLRAGVGTSWSAPVDVSNVSRSDVAVSNSIRSDFENLGQVMQNIGGWRKPSHLEVSNRKIQMFEFQFGISTESMHPPFNRTKLINVMDRFTVVNMLDEPLELRNVNLYGDASSCIVLKPGQENVLWLKLLNSRGNSVFPVNFVNDFLQIRIFSENWMWSGLLDSLQGNSEDKIIRLRDEKNDKVMFVLVHVSKVGSKICVSFQNGANRCPYKIVNNTKYQLCFHQVHGRSKMDSERVLSLYESSNPSTIILPNQSCSYAWDEPLETKELSLEFLRPSDDNDYNDLNSVHSNVGGTWRPLVVSVVHTLEVDNKGDYSVSHEAISRLIVRQGISLEKLSSFELTDISEFKLNANGSGSFLLAKVVVDKDALILKIVDTWDEQDLTITHPTELNENESLNNFELDALSVKFKDIFMKPSLLFLLSIDTFGILMEDQNYDELMYVTTKSIQLQLTHDSNSADTSVKIAVKHLQIDNQIVDSPSPVLLCSVGTDVFDDFAKNFDLSMKSLVFNIHELNERFDMSIDEAKEFVFLGLSLRKREQISVIKTCDLRMSKFDISLESTILLRLRDMIVSIVENINENSWKWKLGSWSKHHSLENQHVSLSDIIIHDKLVEMNASTSAALKETNVKGLMYLDHFEVAPLRYNISINPVTSWEISERLIPLSTRLLFGMMGAVKINSGSFFLNSMKMNHLLCNPDDFTWKLGLHYRNQILGTIPKFLLSFDFIGNPYSLVKGVFKGVQNLVLYPYRGIFVSPGQFLLGIYNGVGSLVFGSVASVLYSAGNFISVAQIALVNFGLVDSTEYGTFIMEKQKEEPIHEGESAELVNLRSHLSLVEMGTDLCLSTITGNKKSLSPSIIQYFTADTLGKSDGKLHSRESRLQSTKIYNSSIPHVYRIERPRSIWDGFYKGFVDGHSGIIAGFNNDSVRGLIRALLPAVLGILGKSLYGSLNSLKAFLVSLAYALLPQLEQLSNKHKRLRVPNIYTGKEDK